MYYGEQGQTITANAASGKTVNLTAHGDENTTNNFDFDDGVLTPHASGADGIVTITATAGDIVEEATIKFMNKDTITITITKSTMYYGEQGQTITANASSGKTVNLTAHGDENTTNNFDFVDGVLTPHGSGNEGIVTITATAGDIVEEATVRLIPNSVNLISAPA
ncbi:hypothetical protein FACS189459_0360 [Bacilli bacterium]|nr:hypothetical protein FACS189459_0360 [Bacilli bacterium]